MSVMNAIREANQIGTLRPTMLDLEEAVITPIFDASDADALDSCDMTHAGLSQTAWE